MELIKQLDNSEFKIKRNAYRHSTTIYTVEKLYGDWPDKQKLIDLCEYGNFTGHVDLNNNVATVYVYTD